MSEQDQKNALASSVSSAVEQSKPPMGYCGVCFRWFETNSNSISCPNCCPLPMKGAKDEKGRAIPEVIDDEKMDVLRAGALKA